jgi:BirA family transcriptional regulator, biotin operon repressor / biotin---[acetyl-CoA-carboxylase] ligase
VNAPPHFGRPRHHHRLIDSTNEHARELAAAGAPGGTVVTASEQTAGRGRQGRTWSAPAGKALLCSAILRPLDARHRLLPLSVPLAVCEAAESLGASGCRVKWPNDVWVEERKLAGILIEARPPRWAVIGIGLNVAIETNEFPPDLREAATSIGSGATVEEALPALCTALDRWVEADDDAVLSEFERRDALRGREIHWTRAGEGSGLVEGVDENGRLLVRVASGEQVSLGSGEVHLTFE